MKHWSVINAALLLALAALALLAYVKPAGEERKSHRLSSLDASEVRRVELQRKGDPPVVLHKRLGRWHIASPLAARADPFHVGRMLAVLDATAIQRLAPADLARFDLDQPLTRLIIEGQFFSFGMVNPVTREQYVLTELGVFAVAPRYGSAVPADVSQLIAKQLFAPEEVPVTVATAAFTVAQRDGQWQVSPAPADPSQDDVQRWIEAWRHAMALRVAPYAAEKPLERVSVGLRDGRTILLDVLQKEGEFVLARSDEKLRYHFAAAAAKRLLAPPGSAPGRPPY